MKGLRSALLLCACLLWICARAQNSQSGNAYTPNIASLSQLPSIAPTTILCNSSGSTAVPSACTAPTVSGLLTAGNLLTGGSLELSASALSMTGTLGLTNSLLYMPGTSITGAPTTPGNGQISPFNLYISGDSVDTVTNGNGNLIGFSFLHAASAGFTGGRTAIQGYLAITGTPTSVNGSGMTGVTALTRVSANMTGTTGAYTNYKGDTFGGNSNVFATSGATFLKTLNGHEFDTTIPTGASAADHFGTSIVKGASHAVRGTYDDSAISLNDQDGPTVGWLYGVSFGGYAHHWPFAADSTLIGAQLRQSGGVETDTALNGVDFRNVSFQSGGFAFASTGYTVDPSGNVITNTLKVTGTSCPATGSGLDNPFGAAIGFCVGGNSKLYVNSSLVFAVVPIESVGTPFTVTGCGTAGSISGGAEGGTFTVGTGATPCTFVFSPNAGASPMSHGYHCSAHNETTGVVFGQTAHSTTTCSMTGNAATGNVIVWGVDRGF